MTCKSATTTTTTTALPVRRCNATRLCVTILLNHFSPECIQVGLSSPDFKAGAPDCTAKFTSNFQQGADVSWKNVRDPGCLKQLGEKAFILAFWPQHGPVLAPPSVSTGEGKPSDFEPK